MIKINPYLNFAGNTEEAFNFYKSVFGGEFQGVNRFKEMPDSDNLSAEEGEKIMHMALPIGNELLMATDALESQGFTVNQGNNFYLNVSPDSREETKRIFDALAEGGTVEMELQDTFWGSYYGSLRDKFGVGWMVNYDESSAL